MIVVLLVLGKDFKWVSLCQYLFLKTFGFVFIVSCLCCNVDSVYFVCERKLYDIFYIFPSLLPFVSAEALYRHPLSTIGSIGVLTCGTYFQMCCVILKSSHC